MEFIIAHSYGVETKSNMKKYQRSVFKQLKRMNGSLLEVNIGGIVKSLRVSVSGIFDMKFLYNWYNELEL